MTRQSTLLVLTLAALAQLAGCPERAEEHSAPDLSASATPESVVTVAPEPEAERGDMEKRRFGKSVDFQFVSAEHNATPGSQLANLRFELLDRSGASAAFTMTHAERSPNAKLMLGHGGVKVTPKLSPPTEEVLGADRATYRWAGWYDVELLSPDGARLGSLSIDWGGEVQAAGDGPGHTIRARYDPSTRRLTMLTVRRTADGRLGDEVLEVHWHSSGFTEHVVTDEHRNRFEYRFPAGRLELVPPEE